jgi:hypothetical protein
MQVDPQQTWHRDELIRPACQHRVKHIMELAASDVRFDVPLNNACSEERNTLCKDVQAGRGRIVRCLQTKCAVTQILPPTLSLTLSLLQP